jgi:pimeloyl-ACP methyl ester carboxylesterase
MTVVRGDVLIARPPAEVFDFVADSRHEPLFNPRMTSCELLTVGPVGNGSRFRAIMRSARRRLPMTVEYTTFDRPRLLASHSEFVGARVDGQLSFEPEGSGTRMRWHWIVTPPVGLRRLDRVVGLIGQRQERRIWRSLKEFLEVTASGSVYVHETGQPGLPAVVFLQGAGASGDMWRGHMAELSSQFHCLALDLPGFGRSNHLPPLSRLATAELVADVIRGRVPAGRARVVGLSWGGAITHTLLDRHPELVDGALIDGAGVLSWRGDKLVLLGIGAVSPFLHTRAVTGLFSRMIGLDAVGRADLEASAPRAFRRAFMEGFKTPALPVELKASCPVLLVAGEKEAHVRPANAALASMMPNAIALFVPGVGHGWMARQSELHIRMVEAWLTGRPLPSELHEEVPFPTVTERLLRHTGDD